MEFKRQKNHLERRPSLGVPMQKPSISSRRLRSRPVKTTHKTPDQPDTETRSLIPENINPESIELTTDPSPHDPAPSSTHTAAPIKPRRETKQLPRLPKKVVVPLILLALVTYGYVAGKQYIEDNQLSISSSGIGRSENAGFEPDFDAVLPGGKSIAELGGWQRVSPPENEPVYAYTDAIGDVSISVSQQVLPAPFKQDTDKHVAELAKQYSATTKIDHEGTKAYVGTSAQGPQSAITTKNNLLILIKSERAIPSSKWGSYIQSLH